MKPLSVKIFTLGLAVLLTGCAGQTTLRLILEPQPNTCQAIEARPTMFSTSQTVVCWGAKGEPLGMASNPGLPGIQVPLQAGGAVADLAGMALGGYFIGKGLEGVGRGIGSVRNSTLDVDVRGKGRVDVVAPQAPSSP